MANPGGMKTRSTISGGTQQAPVLMGRDFHDIHIGDVGQATTAPVALSQLPALTAGFAGRDAELAQITALLDPAGDAGAVVVSAMAGLAGVGKTELAKQAAHFAREAGWFPGGVLFIDLHGYEEAPVGPSQALDALLRTLEVAAEHIPPGEEQRAALYRSALAQIRDPVLIIADNASAEAQVRPLLPGPGPHRVMVTSRHTLAGLGARLLDVTILDDEAAVALLDAALRDARPGDDRIGADRVGAVRLAGFCGGLPLALQIIAALLKADESRTVSGLADELTDEMRRLKALHYDDGGGTSALSVAAAFDLSYGRLDETAGRVFRLLPVNPGRSVSTAAARALTNLPVSDLRTILGQLVQAHLVEAAAGAPDRWKMHDLLRIYAKQLSDKHANADGREQALDRLLDYYLDTAREADARLRALPGKAVPVTFADRASALAWLDAERASLVGAITIGRDQAAMELPHALCQYFYSRRLLDDWLDTLAICLKTARKVGNRHQEARALAKLGWARYEAKQFGEGTAECQEAVAIFRETRQDEGEALTNLGLNLRKMHNKQEASTAVYLEKAGEAYEEAVALFKEIGDRHGEGIALSNLGRVLGSLGRFQEAIDVGKSAVAIVQETHDRQEEPGALFSLGRSLQKARKLKEAIITYEAAVRVCRDVHDLYVEGQVHAFLGQTYLGLERKDQAITCYREAVKVHRQAGNRRLEDDTLISLSQVYDNLKQPNKRRKCLAAAKILRSGDYYDLTGLLEELDG